MGESSGVGRECGVVESEAQQPERSYIDFVAQRAIEVKETIAALKERGLTVSVDTVLLVVVLDGVSDRLFQLRELLAGNVVLVDTSENGEEDNVE